MKPEDNSVLCFLVVSMLNELKVQYELFSCWDGGLTNGSEHPDQTCNSPYCQPYNSYNFSTENLVLDQLIIPK